MFWNAPFFAAEIDLRGSEFIAFTNFKSFEEIPDPAASVNVYASPTLEAGLDWDELIVSWNLRENARGDFEPRIRVVFPERASRWYSLGLWSARTNQTRASVPDQRDGDGEVKTDTLKLSGAAKQFQVQLRLRGGLSLRDLKLLGISLHRTGTRVPGLPSNRAGWDWTLDVPEISQFSFAEGKGWCSPTCTAMVLRYWSAKLGRPELNCEVPRVAAEVNDPNWPGTGNWPFNTAFAGAFSGMRAYVTRLSGIAEIEAWVGAGVPVIASVSLGLLQGDASKNRGHLIVCRGFTAAGEPIINDPGTRLSVRKTITRETLEKAWGASNRTVYLIYPESWPVPPDRFHHWAERAPKAAQRGK